MGQREVYEVLKTSGKWLFSKEVADRLEDNIGSGNLSRNLAKLRQSGMVKRELIKMNIFKYKAI